MGKIGLEYNYGSEYWTPFTQAQDDMLGSKLATRGHVGEAYYIVDVNPNMFLKFGGLYYDYGIDRPAIATIFPNLKDQTLVLDVGGNVDCKPLHLSQFALMGAVYARHVLGKERPRVGLLSNGEEESKGNDLTREAHQLLKGATFEYIGYVEGRDIFNGSVDVVVCDGFVGNVVLKVSEGLADTILTLLRKEIGSRFLARIGYLLARPAFGAFKKKVDYAEYGGAPLLGIEGTGMICHGGSSPRAISNAIRMAHEYAARRVNDQLVAQLQSDAVNQGTVVDTDPPVPSGRPST
jgi:glycerol-3-phosphate acyltransferase PlsX